MSSQSILYQGTVLDNKDPLMLGRIRAKINIINLPDTLKSVEDWSNSADAWTEKDPLIFTPLIPYFLYQVPEVGELIQIMFMNFDFKFQNQFYIQSNFFSPSSSFFTYNASGSYNTGTGFQVKPPRNLKKKDGNWDDPTEAGIYPEPLDNALLGRGSADVIVKKNELILRAGKFSEPPQSNTVAVSNPNRAFLQLSNFDRTKSGEETQKIISTTPITLLVNYLIEWVINNPENNANRFNGSVYLYSLKPSVKYNTDNFTVTTEVSVADKFLIDTENFTQLSMIDTIRFINSYIATCNQSNVSRTGAQLFSESTNKFPIFFRPTVEMYNIINPSSGISNINVNSKRNLKIVYNGTKLNTADPGGYGLIWKKDTVGLPSKVQIQEVKTSNFKYQPNTLAALGGQKIYLLSQDSDIEGKQKINFANSVYGIAESAFTETIQANTSSMVRGEELLELINLIYNFLVSHTHAYPGLAPVSKTQSGIQVEDLDRMMQSARRKILNSNIRLN